MSDMQQLQEQMETLRKELAGVKGAVQEDKMSMVLFSGDLDKALAAFIIATGSVAMGMESVIFLTFWGTPLFRKPDKNVAGKDFMSKMFGWMLPKGSAKATLSKMNMGGMGTVMLKDLMKKKNVASLPQIMGFKREEMIDYPDLKYAGVATFLAEAKNSKVQLFL